MPLMTRLDPTRPDSTRPELDELSGVPKDGVHSIDERFSL